MADKLRIAVLGASGYTGADLVRLAIGHPMIEIVALAAGARAGASMADVWPHFAPYTLPPIVAADAVDWSGIDFVFGCLPHGASATLLSQIHGPRIIDLSADFRLSDAKVYEHWYGLTHPAPALLDEAVYGLTEMASDALPDARLVACPGCYPTAALLALLPVADFIDTARVTITALSGVSGAGRSTKEANLFAELGESAAAYAVGHHRHMPEIEQILSSVAGTPATVSFTPHLVPMTRGELVTIIVEHRGLRSPAPPASELRALLKDCYRRAPFVHILPEGVAPSTRMVRGSNHCVLNVFADRVPGRAILISAIDNLVKGSSGQAIQNMNLMAGLPETMGLEQVALFP